MCSLMGIYVCLGPSIYFPLGSKSCQVTAILSSLQRTSTEKQLKEARLLMFYKILMNNYFATPFPTQRGYHNIIIVFIFVYL